MDTPTLIVLTNVGVSFGLGTALSFVDKSKRLLKPTLALIAGRAADLISTYLVASNLAEYPLSLEGEYSPIGRYLLQNYGILLGTILGAGVDALVFGGTMLGAYYLRKKNFDIGDRVYKSLGYSFGLVGCLASRINLSYLL